MPAGLSSLCTTINIRGGGLRENFAIFNREPVWASLLAAIDASTRDAGLDPFPTLWTRVCVLFTCPCNDVTIYHRELVYAPLLAAVDASIRHAGLDRLPTVRTAVCVLRTVACDDFTIFHREPVYAPLLAADLSIGDAGSDPFLTVWTRTCVAHFRLQRL